MAGVAGNRAAFAWAKQVSKGTPNTTYAHKSGFSGGNIAPSRNIEQLSETDATRQEGVSYVSQTAVEGSPELYVRDENIHSLLEAVLGSKATTGAGPDYEHELTPAATLPYYTFARTIGGVIHEQFQDCLVSELVISADTGGPLTATATVMGTRATFLGSEPAAAVDLASSEVYNFNNATVSEGGSPTSLVSSFELTISNNVSLQQTDDSVPYDVIAGTFSVALSYDKILVDDDNYREFHYGTTSGTAQSNTIVEKSIEFAFSLGANNDVTFTMDHMAFEEYPVDPDPGGDPIVVPTRCRAQRDLTDPAVIAVVNNQKAT